MKLVRQSVIIDTAPETREQLVTFYKALADVSRLKIVGLLAQGKDSVKSLLKAIYPELDKRLYGMATGQILSHLHKLQSEGKVRLEGKGADTKVIRA